MKQIFTVNAGLSSTLPMSGKFIYVASATGEFSLQIRDTAGRLTEDIYDTYDFIDLEGRAVKEVTVTDTSGASNTVVLKGLKFKVTAGNSSTRTTRISSIDLGERNDSPAGSDVATASLISLFKRLLQKIPSLGQAAMTASQPVVIASDQTAVPVSGTFWQATQPVSIGAAVAVTGTFWQATQPVSIGAAVAVTGALDASATGGATSARIITAATTNDTNVKASAGKVYAITGTNTSAGLKYLKLYNKATTPTVGTDTPLLTFALPVGAFNFDLAGSVGADFSAGIGYGVTGAAGDADTTATAVNDVIASITYK